MILRSPARRSPALRLVAALAAAAVFAAAPGARVAHADPAGRITGIGGVFVTSPDPRALAAWYRDVLGIELQPWGGAMLRYDAAGHPPVAVWSAFPEGSEELAPSARPFMLNFAVDDLDAFVARVAAKGVPILSRDDTGPNGRFAAIQDPDGTKIELWEPKRDGGR